MSYWRLRKRVELLKKAQGKVFVEIPDELVRADEELAGLKAQLASADELGWSDEKKFEVEVRVKALERQVARIMAAKGLKRTPI